MSKVERLNARVSKLLTVAVQEVLDVVRETVSEYQDKTSRTQRENERLKRKVQELQEKLTRESAGADTSVSGATCGRTPAAQEDILLVKEELPLQSPEDKHQTPVGTEQIIIKCDSSEDIPELLNSGLTDDSDTEGVHFVASYNNNKNSKGPPGGLRKRHQKQAKQCKEESDCRESLATRTTAENKFFAEEQVFVEGSSISDAHNPGLDGIKPQHHNCVSDPSDSALSTCSPPNTSLSYPESTSHPCSPNVPHNSIPGAADSAYLPVTHIIKAEPETEDSHSNIATQREEDVLAGLDILKDELQLELDLASSSQALHADPVTMATSGPAAASLASVTMAASASGPVSPESLADSSLHIEAVTMETTVSASSSLPSSGLYRVMLPYVSPNANGHGATNELFLDINGRYEVGLESGTNGLLGGAPLGMGTPNCHRGGLGPGREGGGVREGVGSRSLAMGPPNHHRGGRGGVGSSSNLPRGVGGGRGGVGSRSSSLGMGYPNHQRGGIGVGGGPLGPPNRRGPSGGLGREVGGVPRPYSRRHNSYTASSSSSVGQSSAAAPKRYCCPLCSRSFNHAGDFKKHKRVHTGERPYACGVCGKRFSQSGYLTVHLRYHTGERPYTCTVCQKSFSHSSNFRKHQQTHLT